MLLLLYYFQIRLNNFFKNFLINRGGMNIEFEIRSFEEWFKINN